MVDLPIGFCIKVDHLQISKITRYLKRNNIVHGVLYEFGAIIPDGSKYVIEYNELDIWFASIDFLDRSKDGIFCSLRKDGRKKILPSLEDIFIHKEV